MLSRENEYGVQPLNELMEGLGLQNNDFVQHSTQQLTYKQVQKARKGRTVTLNVKKKIVFALNACARDDKFNIKDLFNY